MNIILTQEQNQQYINQVKELAAEYERKRKQDDIQKGDPLKIHKFNGGAFVDRKIHAFFKGGQPEKIQHNGKLLGNGSFCVGDSTAANSVFFPIGEPHQKDKVQQLIQNSKELIITVYSFSDGCMYTEFALAYNPNTKESVDFSIHM